MQGIKSAVICSVGQPNISVNSANVAWPLYVASPLKVCMSVKSVITILVLHVSATNARMRDVNNVPSGVQTAVYGFALNAV